MNTARIVADHPAHGAAVVRGRIRTEGESVLVSRIPQIIVDDPRLYPCKLFVRVQMQNFVHVLTEVDDDGNITALPGEAGGGAAVQHRRTEIAADANGVDNVLFIARNDHSYRRLPVI